MRQLFDIYVQYAADTRDGLERVRKDFSLQVDWRVALLASVTGNDKIKEMGRTIYRGYLPSTGPAPYETESVHPGLAGLECLGLSKPGEFPSAHLPWGSWMFRFMFTLAKPYLSRDDQAFYVIDNPVRKDKVFKVPMCSGASWKGNLHWTAVKLMVDRHAVPDPESPLGFSVSADHATAFAEERFQLVRLFGSEKGEEPGNAKGIAAYLDSLSAESAECYRLMVRNHFHVQVEDPLPHHNGRLLYYSTFFDKIGLEVINPHDRKRRVGKQPIYFECVPIGAKGTFTLLYVPFDLIGKPLDVIKDHAKADLTTVAEVVRDMFLTYGFSAKKSSGFGLAQPAIEDGLLQATWLKEPRPLASLQSLVEDMSNV